jgi:hypothetical protein
MTTDIIADLEPAAWRMPGGSLTSDPAVVRFHKAIACMDGTPLYTRDQLLQALSDVKEKTLLHQSDAKMAWGECEAERQRADRAEAEAASLREFVDEDKADADKWRKLACIEGPLNSFELWKDRAEAAEARLSEAGELLKPFANDAREIAEAIPDDTLFSMDGFPSLVLQALTSVISAPPPASSIRRRPMKNDELLACPFCGGLAKVTEHIPAARDAFWSVSCRDCHATIPKQWTRETVVGNWNSRAALSTQPQAGEAVAWLYEVDVGDDETPMWEAWSCPGNPPVPSPRVRNVRPLYAAPPPASDPVAVKALEWSRPEGTHETVTILRANCLFGYYEAWGGGGWNINGGPNITGGPRDIESAKAAAQADYEARIRSSLVSPALPSRGELEEAQATISKLANEITAHHVALETVCRLTSRCEHDGGFDREIGPIGCNLGDKCVCIGIYPVARDALGMRT